MPRLLAGVALASILCAGLWLRTTGLERNPPGFYTDEAAVGVNAWLIARGGIDQYGRAWPLFFRALDDYKEPVYVYTTAVWLAFHDLTVRDTRRPAALWGSLGLLVAFALARELLGAAEAGLWCALLACLAPFHIQYSRWAEQAIVLSVVYSAAVLFLARLARRGSRTDGVLAGLLLASGFYCYTTARLLVPLTLAAFVAFAWRTRRLATPALRFCLGSFGLAALPFAVAYLSQARLFNLRFGSIRLPLSLLPAAFLSHLDPFFLFVRGDDNLRHSGGAPLLAWYVAPLGALGAVGLWRVRPRVAAAVLGILGANVALGGLSTGFPHATRVITLLPFAQLLAAAGVQRALSLCRGSWRVTARLAVLAFVLASFGRFWQGYWTDYAVAARREWRYGLLPALELAARLARPGERVYAPPAHYAEWLFVARTPPAEIAAERRQLERDPDRYDPADEQGRYAFLGDRALLGLRVGGASFREPLPAGIWVVDVGVPLERRLPGCLFRDADYCVSRVESPGR